MGLAGPVLPPLSLVSAGKSASSGFTYCNDPAERITVWLAPGQRVILPTVFRKTRNAEVACAGQAQKLCEAEHCPARETFDREVPRRRGIRRAATAGACPAER